MRIERWYWLSPFLFLSLCVHLGVIGSSRTLIASTLPRPPQQEIVVALQAAEPELPPPQNPPPQPPHETPPPPSAQEIKRDRAVMSHLMRKLEMPRPSPGPALPTVLRPLPPAPIQKDVASSVAPSEVVDDPLPSGLPLARKDAGETRPIRIAQRDVTPGGGGSPSPAPIPGGRGGLKAPEAPPEDILYNGGGAGGLELPRAAPRMGGGGGTSILGVENPLASEAVPDQKPGIGAGKGGGEGEGAGRGVGYVQGQGIGTRPDGAQALATLRAKPGTGIGAGEGDRIGTRAPGGGSGTGAELPGTGGTGIGYGRGSGVGIGNGSGTGAGDGAGVRVGLNRGIPFGDIAGLLRGGLGGGGGGEGGRGGVFGKGTGDGGDGGGAVHIAYLIDVSGSMEEGDKMGKAKEALKKALSELKSGDSFNIIAFAGTIRAFADDLVPVTPGNISAARLYVDFLQIRPATNISAALAAALEMKKLTHIFLLSDGEPNRGIQQPWQMRQMVREMNTQKARIITLALGLGETWRGMQLLKDLAADHNGQFSYVNLAEPRAGSR